GAGEDRGPVGRESGIHGGADGGEPGGAVGVVERDAAAHLVLVGLAVEVIGLVVGPAEPGGEQPAEGGLAGAGDAHEENKTNGHRAGVTSIRSQVSRKRTGW